MHDADYGGWARALWCVSWVNSSIVDKGFEYNKCLIVSFQTGFHSTRYTWVSNVIICILELI